MGKNEKCEPRPRARGSALVRRRSVRSDRRRDVAAIGAAGPKSSLQNRLLFHLSHKFSDEKRLMNHHQSLRDTIEDQLSLASIHYLRSHYQEAIDIYKRILLDNRRAGAGGMWWGRVGGLGRGLGVRAGCSKILDGPA